MRTFFRLIFICFFVISSCSSKRTFNELMSTESPNQPTEKKNPNEISIGTYNVENMWDDVENNSTILYDDFKDSKSNWYKYNMANKKVLRLKKVIELAGAPDILLLQEIESAKNHSRSLELLKPVLKDLGYEYFVLGNQGNEVAITTAVISKYPILENTSLPFEFIPSAEIPEGARAGFITASRDPQVVTVSVQNVPVRVYNSHWKSQRGRGELEKSEGLKERLAVAKLIRDDIDQTRHTQPNLAIVVGGDLNSEYNSDEVVNGLNSTGDEREMMKPGGSNKLYNLWYEIAEESRGSTVFDDHFDCFDNLLVADSVYLNQGLQLIPKSFHVVGRSGVAREQLVNGDGVPFRSQLSKKYSNHVLQSARHIDYGFSDHLPLVAKFLLVNGDAARVAHEPSSIIERAEIKNIPIKLAPCNEYVGNIDSSGPQRLGTCVKLNFESPLRLTRQGPSMGFKLGSQRWDIEYVNARTKNKPASVSLINLEGKSLKSIQGRYGWKWNFPVIFIEKSDDVAVSN